MTDFPVSPRLCHYLSSSTMSCCFNIRYLNVSHHGLNHMSILTRHTRLFLVLSGILYTFPFFAPDYLWWLIFFFPLFLFYALATNELPNTDCVLWSLATTGIHLFALCRALMLMAAGSVFLRLIPVLLLIFYVSFYPLVWLLIVRILFTRVASTYTQKLSIWTISLWVYLMIVQYGLFWVFGRYEGNICMNPLLPLAMYPHLLAPFLWFSLAGALLIFSVISAIICYAAHRGGLPVTFAISVGLMFLIASFKPHKSPPAPAWLSSVGHLPLMIPQSLSLDHGLNLIEHELDQLEKNYPALRMVILPESAWNGTAISHLNGIPVFTSRQTTDLIIGSFSPQENGHQNNSIFWFHKGPLTGRFDKCHAIPFVERIPLMANWLCRPLFFSKSPPICTSDRPRHFIQTNNVPLLLPYICSELFCLNRPLQKRSSNYTILALCNDWWFNLPYFANLMVLVARLRALEWDHPILYISFRHAHYFDQRGNEYPIATTTK